MDATRRTRTVSVLTFHIARSRLRRRATAQTSRASRGGERASPPSLRARRRARVGDARRVARARWSRSTSSPSARLWWSSASGITISPDSLATSRAVPPGSRSRSGWVASVAGSARRSPRRARATRETVPSLVRTQGVARGAQSYSKDSVRSGRDARRVRRDRRRFRGEPARTRRSSTRRRGERGGSDAASRGRARRVGTRAARVRSARAIVIAALARVPRASRSFARGAAVARRRRRRKGRSSASTSAERCARRSRRPGTLTRRQRRRRDTRANARVAPSLVRDVATHSRSRRRPRRRAPAARRRGRVFASRL